jgi:asparaginyl-tRNA synthetase
LTVSSQLHLEAFVHEHQKVWTLSPTFRAEKSDTPRHLSEFYMLEAEIRTDKLSEVMVLVENMIRDMVIKLQNTPLAKELLMKHSVEAEKDKWLTLREDVVQRRWQGLKRSCWPRITYTQAITVLNDAHDTGKAVFKYKPEWKAGLQLEHEKFIASEIGLGSPVFVTDYPKVVKPFYMLPSQDRNDTVACFDLLLPETCEVVGGSLREHRLDTLRKSMEQHNLLNPALDWYLDLRRYGSVPHGGFGMGFDRLLGYLAGVENVRDIVPWPRYYGRCDG